MKKPLCLLFVILIFNMCKKEEDQVPYIASHSLPVEDTINYTQINILVDGFENLDGSLAIAIHNSKSQFDEEIESYRDTVVDILSEEMSIVIDSVTFGEYTVSIFHDENQDGQLNTGFLNIPTEGFGFSNNPTLGFSKPTFDECKFVIEEIQNIVIPITLNYF